MTQHAMQSPTWWNRANEVLLLAAIPRKRRHEPPSALRKAGISVAEPESDLILP